LANAKKAALAMGLSWPSMEPIAKELHAAPPVDK
jgi:hypothetical protein